MDITVTNSLQLRDVRETDLSLFFGHQLDREANYMAAFTAQDPTDRDAIFSRWKKVLTDPTVIFKTILLDDQIVGSVLSYEEEALPQVSYWIGKEHWGQGIATRALTEFLMQCNLARPIYARAVKDNHRSLRVLKKCGFIITGEHQDFAHPRGTEADEYTLILN
ncbi:MAG: acetyltransferase [Verrucomicrobia bacterium]|nr:acetyltransferase [Verrucomicrobiota bacterium]